MSQALTHGRFALHGRSGRFAVIGVLVAAVCGAAAVPVQEDRAPVPPAASEVVHVRVEGALDIGTKSLLRRAIARARASSERLVIEIDTPGGAIDTMFQLATQVADATKEGVLTVAWVHDQALSAGTLLALSCERMYMTSQGTIGAAGVVVQTPGGIASIPDAGAREKITSAVRTSFRAFAESGGRSPELAQAMVDPDVGVRQVRIDGEVRLITNAEWDDAATRPEGRPTLLRTVNDVGRLLALSGSEAVGLGFADGIAENMAQVLDKIGARSARTVVIERTRSEDYAAFLDQIKFLLLIAAVVAMWAEIKAPGFGVPGAVAIACLGLLLFGRYLVGLADVPHIVAVAAGVVLIALELFVLPGTIWLGVAGAVLALGGLVLANVGTGLADHALARELALNEVFNMTMSMLAAVVVAMFVSRFLPRIPVVSRFVLEPTDGLGRGLAEPPGAAERRPQPGERGRALTDLRPVGKVALERGGDVEYEARADGAALERGATVRVIEWRAGRLIVEEDRA